MNDERSMAHIERRSFLKRVAVLSGAASIAQTGTSAIAVEAGAPSPAQDGTAQINQPLGYTSLSPDEAAFVEALVNVMCPADGYTASGVDCGLVVYIDRQLGGGFGHAERLYRGGPWKAGKPQHGFQLPLTPEQFFKLGIEAAQEACNARFGERFEALSPPDADLFLQDVSTGKVASARVSLASWFNESLYPLFVQACFADPIYGGKPGQGVLETRGISGLASASYAKHDGIPW